MIKYLNTKGYKNLGECGMFSHVYQWMEEENDNTYLCFRGKAYDI